MPNIILTEDDLKKMEPQLRQSLLSFIYQSLTKNASTNSFLPEIIDDYFGKAGNRLSEFKTPFVIPIEGAYSILMGLNKNCLNFMKELLRGKFIQFKKTKGVSKREMSHNINVSEASLNGIVGSINRRFRYRFNKEVYLFDGNTPATHPQSPYYSTKLIYYDPSSEEKGFICYYWLNKHKANFLNFEIAIKLYEMTPNFELFKYKITIPNKKLEFFIDDSSITSFDQGKGYLSNSENKSELNQKPKNKLFLDTYMLTEQTCHSIKTFRKDTEYLEIGPAKFNFDKMKFDTKKENREILQNFELNIDQIKIEEHKKILNKNVF